MKKSEAKKLFGSYKAIADALGITRGAVSQWPEELGPRLSDEISGAHARLVSDKKILNRFQ